jgi:hypothetical protein
MGVYSTYLLPRLIDLVMRGKAQADERAKVVPLAGGVVVEIGSGSGLNAPFFRRVGPARVHGRPVAGVVATWAEPAASGPGPRSLHRGGW